MSSAVAAVLTHEQTRAPVQYTMSDAELFRRARRVFSSPAGHAFFAKVMVCSAAVLAAVGWLRRCSILLASASANLFFSVSTIAGVSGHTCISIAIASLLLSSASATFWIADTHF